MKRSQDFQMENGQDSSSWVSPQMFYKVISPQYHQDHPQYEIKSVNSAPLQQNSQKKESPELPEETTPEITPFPSSSGTPG